MLADVVAPPLSALRFAVRRDLDDLFDRVNAIRTTYTRPSERQPLSCRPCERRMWSRIALRVPVCVSPVIVENDQVVSLDESSEIPAQTTNLSLKGAGLVHVDPFSRRHASVTFSLPERKVVRLLAELAWTYAGIDGLHHTGARFLAVIDG